jgi:acetylornithine/N-succinyldiaminopimelate aminotransferase
MQGLVRPAGMRSQCARCWSNAGSSRAMGLVLGLFPPLRVEESEINTAVSAIDAICAREEQ